MFATGIQQNLQARHYLQGNFGEESRPHSHPYRVELICRSPKLDANGFSTDIDFLESSLSSILTEIDNVLLNDLPYFKDRQPSLENLCVYIFEKMLFMSRSAVEQVADLPQEIEIRIWESATAWASFSGPTTASQSS
ncbi:MAG: 6-carboxytetrahydropterin synthase [Spirochaetaceae bacterium]|nr:6-carboxytetrahydropterin synthase [Spirochaetaceae bacterium]MCF7950735.1 6-carboxytetrahydropterin synthase [Spirochaetaceae bacterium]